MCAYVLTRLLHELLEPSPCLSASIDQSKPWRPWHVLCKRWIDEVKDRQNALCHLLASAFPGVTVLGDLLALHLLAVTVFYHGLQMLLCIDFYNYKPHMLLRRYTMPNYGRQQK